MLEYERGDSFAMGGFPSRRSSVHHSRKVFAFYGSEIAQSGIISHAIFRTPSCTKLSSSHAVQIVTSPMA